MEKMSEVEWSKEKVFKLIELFREHRVLWDATHVEYKMRNKKQDAWSDIALEMNVDRDEVEKKMRCLIGQYQRNSKKCKSGSGADSDPKWPFYNLLHFLRDKSKPRKFIETNLQELPNSQKMPRTKQVRKTSTRKRATCVGDNRIQSTNSHSSVNNQAWMGICEQDYESIDEFKKAFINCYNKESLDFSKSYENLSNDVRKMFSNSLKVMPQSWKSRSLSDNHFEDKNTDQNKDPNTNTTKRVSRLTRSTTDLTKDKFEFKMPKNVPIHKTRSSTRKRSVSASSVDSRSTTSFKTPLTNRTPIPPNCVITPKVSDQPLSMMRRPLLNEVAVSMSGSPLMLGPLGISESMPCVNLPLQDGRVFSIMPEPGAPPPDLPHIDEATKEYLKTLKRHLEFLAPSSP